MRRLTLIGLLALALALPTTLAVPVVDNDAGSGRDAPSGPEDAVPIEVGVVYSGVVTSLLDMDEWYAFEARAGDVLRASLLGIQGSFGIADAERNVLTKGLLIGGLGFHDGFVMTTIPADGTYYFFYRSVSTESYRFSVYHDGTYPPVVPVTVWPVGVYP